MRDGCAKLLAHTLRSVRSPSKELLERLQIHGDVRIDNVLMMPNDRYVVADMVRDTVCLECSVQNASHA